MGKAVTFFISQIIDSYGRYGWCGVAIRVYILQATFLGANQLIQMIAIISPFSGNIRIQ